MDMLDKAALSALSAACTAAVSLGTVTIAVFTTTVPAWGPLGWIGLTAVTTTTVALPVAGVVVIGGAATWGGIKVYKAMTRKQDNEGESSPC